MYTFAWPKPGLTFGGVSSRPLMRATSCGTALQSTGIGVVVTVAVKAGTAVEVRV